MNRMLQTEIEGQIVILNRQITALEDERKSLERILRRLRNEDEAVRRSSVTRKNSTSRILIENAVLNALKRGKDQKKEPTRAKTLFHAAKESVPSLHPNNFRTILHRMNERGIVIPVRRGFWALPPQDGSQA